MSATENISYLEAFDDVTEEAYLRAVDITVQEVGKNAHALVASHGMLAPAPEILLYHLLKVYREVERALLHEGDSEDLSQYAMGSMAHLSTVAALAAASLASAAAAYALRDHSNAPQKEEDA